MGAPSEASETRMNFQGLNKSNSTIAMASLAQSSMRLSDRYGREIRPITPQDLLPSGTKDQQQDQVQSLAEKWVAQTFYGTLLKQMRESPFRSEIFDGGRGGQAFGALFDQHIAERLSHGAGGKLTRALAHRMQAKSAYAKQHPLDRSESAVPARAPSLPNNLRKDVKIHVAPATGT
jgi:Rod binding domain-containing protein